MFEGLMEKIFGSGGVEQEQHEAIFELLILASFVDGTVSADETNAISSYGNRVNWDSPTSPERFYDMAVSRVRDCLGSEEKMREFILQAKERLPEGEVRQRAMQECVVLAQSDGDVSPEEAMFIEKDDELKSAEQKDPITDPVILSANMCTKMANIDLAIWSIEASQLCTDGVPNEIFKGMLANPFIGEDSDEEAFSRTDGTLGKLPLVTVAQSTAADGNRDIIVAGVIASTKSAALLQLEILDDFSTDIGELHANVNVTENVFVEEIEAKGGDHIGGDIKSLTIEVRGDPNTMVTRESTYLHEINENAFLTTIESINETDFFRSNNGVIAVLQNNDQGSILIYIERYHVSDLQNVERTIMEAQEVKLRKLFDFAESAEE